MILLVNLCSDRMSMLEFVRPIEQILSANNIEYFEKHRASIRREDWEKAQKIIICGTALMDAEYLRSIDGFNWLRDVKKPVLGICAGFHILGRVFRSGLVEKARIGQFKVRVVRENSLTSGKEFYSYFLSSKDLKRKRPLETLALAGDLDCMVKHEHKEIYGCLFFPEVLNPDIILNFCRCV